MPEYKSNMNVVIKELIQDLRIDSAQISLVAAQQLLGDMIYRIHQEGKAASGQIIASSYSTNPMYVSLNMFVRQSGKPAGSKAMKRLRGRGKNSTSPTFKNGSKRRSRYFPQGYKEFKQEQTGKTKVNLSLSGGLQHDLMLRKADSKSFGLSFSNYGLDIYKGLENHYNVIIWFPTKEEQKRMSNAVEEFIIKRANRKK